MTVTSPFVQIPKVAVVPAEDDDDAILDEEEDDAMLDEVELLEELNEVFVEFVLDEESMFFGIEIFFADVVLLSHQQELNNKVKTTRYVLLPQIENSLYLKP